MAGYNNNYKFNVENRGSIYSIFIKREKIKILDFHDFFFFMFK